MKKIIRSLVWTDQAEKEEASNNYKHVVGERFLNMRKVETTVLEYLLDFFQRKAESPQLSSLLDHFETAQDAEAVVLIEEAAPLKPYHAASFTDLIEQEVEFQAAGNLAQTCKNAIKIATDGLKIGKGIIQGTDEAVAYLFSEVTGKPDTGDGKMSASLKESSQGLTELYQDRKKNPHQTYGVLTGYGLFDKSTAGIRKKQLYLHAGFGGHLKSTHMLNMSVNAAVDGGWNPMIFTSEMPAEDLKMMLIAIHSANPKFTNEGRPISSFRLLLGALNDDEEKFFELVKDDLVNNPQHGLIRVVDSAEFTSLGTVFQRTIREHAEIEVDILWIDYITRLPLDPKYRGADTTTARNETIADAKRFAMSFDGGAGLAICSPFQVNREGYKRAKASEGRMDKTALAQYNSAEREADIITYIYFDIEEQATSEPKIGMLKSRWGATIGDPISVYIEPESRRIIDLSAGMVIHPGAAPTSAMAAEDEVIL